MITMEGNNQEIETTSNYIKSKMNLCRVIEVSNRTCIGEAILPLIFLNAIVVSL
jgi:hypothetical protein